MSPIPPGRLGQLAALDKPQEVAPRPTSWSAQEVAPRPPSWSWAWFCVTHPVLYVGYLRNRASIKWDLWQIERAYRRFERAVAVLDRYAAVSEDEHAESLPAGGVFLGWLVAVGAGLLGTALVCWSSRVLGWIR